jgi:cytochrome c-type biogenesis protein
MDTISGWAQSLADALRSSLATGSATAYLIVFLAGVVASLTPCVYPMIPITISVIGGRTKKGPKEGFLLSVAYALGIATTYALIGMIFAGLRRFAGQQIGMDALSNSPWVAAAVAIICLLFAMVMLERLSIPMPAGVQAWQSKQRGGGGFLTTYLAGIAFGTVASPCLAPVVGLIALEIAKTGRILYGGTMLFTFGMGLGVLFIVVGTFAGATSALPKAGMWMDRIKSVFAWLMLAIALAYMFQAGKLAKSAEYAALERGAPKAATTGQAGAMAAPYAVPSDSTIAPLAVGAPARTLAPDAPLTGEAGGTGKLSDLWQDKTLVLVFYAPWCKNCPEKIPHANELAKQMPDKARVLGVGTTVSSADSKVWAKKHDVQYDLLFDPAGSLLAAYHPEDTGGLPWTVIIARSGEILYRDVSWPREAADLVAQGFAATPSRGAGPSVAAPSTGSEPAVQTGTPAAPATAGAGPYEVIADPALEPAGEAGSPAPAFALKDAEGGATSLSAWTGQAGVLLCIYGGAGGEDTRGIAAAEKVAAPLGEGLRVLEVTGAPTLAEAKTWAEENGAKHELLVDPSHELLRLFGGEGASVPLYVFIAKGGSIVYKGAWPPDAAELARSAAGGR